MYDPASLEHLRQGNLSCDMCDPVTSEYLWKGNLPDCDMCDPVISEHLRKGNLGCDVYESR